MSNENKSLQKYKHTQLEYPPVAQMAMTVSEVADQITMIHNLMKTRMIKGYHYGPIPGCPEDQFVLYKPGAELIAVMFQLRAEYIYTTEDLPNEHKNFTVETRFYHIPTGTQAGMGIGSCSTMESKYRYRNDFTGKTVPEEYWTARDPSLLGGRGYSYKKRQGTWYITRRVEFEDPADYWNTALKMAKKRSFGDAVQVCTAAGEVFHRYADNPEELEEELIINGVIVEEEEVKKPARKSSASKANQKPKSPPAATDSNIPNCPKCGGLMWDNRKGQKHAERGADLVCRDKNCRWKMTKDGSWEPSNFQTSIYRYDPEPEVEYLGSDEDMVVEDDDILF